MRLTHRPRRRARVEMIPLIDAMFLLLVFFIYSMLSMTVHRGIIVNLPEAETGEVEHKDHVAISIDQGERIFLNKEEVSLSSLRSRLKEVKRDEGDRQVFINADRMVRYETIISVLDMVRSAGLYQVSLETQERADAS